MINLLSSLIIPIMVLVVIIYGVVKKIDIYDVFIDGAKESFDMTFTMFPCLLGMILGINIFINSGLLEFIFGFLKPFLNFINVPIQVFPMIVMRPISGSASLAILNNLFESYGPDSFIGILSSVIQGSTDTTFYVLTLYFGSVGIKKIRYALWVGLLSDLIGILSALFLVNCFFT